VRSYAVVPIHADAMDLALKRGRNDPERRLSGAGVTELLDSARTSVTQGGRRWLGR